jgi:sucrose-6-phosphate hydrolase SacC (GH32 family)
MTAQHKRDAIIKLMAADPQAPRYHFIAPEGNAMPFDPNGAIFRQGRYHLFYIFQDPDLPHGGHCWGHASSRDLLHWDFHPTALAPGPSDPDKGIFSGNAFVSKEGIPTIAYYGIDTGICLAQSTDEDLRTWTKLPENPIIPEPRQGDPGWGVYNVFDPHIWLEGDTYYAILGGRVKPHEIRDTAYLFESRDLVSWRYLRPFYHPHPDWTDRLEDCACPDFFRLGERHALVCISHSHGARVYLGRWQDGTFVPEEHQRMNWPGGSCFAPETLQDGRGRRILWAWVLDQRKGDGRFKNELGVMSLPRALSLDSRGRLNIRPVEELEQLRRNPRHIENLAVEPRQEQTLAEVQGDCLELALEAVVPDGSAFGVKVRVSPSGEEQTALQVDRASGTISIDTSQSSLRPDIFQPFPMMGGKTCEDVRTQTAPFLLDPGEKLKLRLFLDKSILEVFANQRQCLTQRIYPSRDDSLGVALFSQGAGVKVTRVEAWDMAAANEKTT